MSTVRGDLKRGLRALDGGTMNALINCIHQHPSFVHMSKLQFDDVVKKTVLPSIGHLCKELRKKKTRMTTTTRCNVGLPLPPWAGAPWFFMSTMLYLNYGITTAITAHLFLYCCFVFVLLLLRSGMSWGSFTTLSLYCCFVLLPRSGSEVLLPFCLLHFARIMQPHTTITGLLFLYC